MNANKRKARAKEKKATGNKKNWFMENKEECLKTFFAQPVIKKKMATYEQAGTRQLAELIMLMLVIISQEALKSLPESLLKMYKDEIERRQAEIMLKGQRCLNAIQEAKEKEENG